MVLIWPDNLPRLPLTPHTSGCSSSAIIVGFVDEHKFSTVVIGAITFDSKVHTDAKKEVVSAIKLLATCHPCCNRQSEGDCRECIDCTTYQSLRVITVAFDDNNGVQKNMDKQKEVIIYNPTEANTWNAQCNQFRRINTNKVGAMQTLMHMMSKSSVVFRELSSVLKNNTSTYAQQKMNNIHTSTVEVPSGYYTDPNCNTITQENPDWFGEQSLFSLHWHSSAANQNNLLEKRVPFVHALKSIWKERRCSISLVAISFDFVMGLMIGAALINNPTPIIQQIGQAVAYHDNFFNGNLNWLETFPGGFKLNVALTHRIGKETRWMLFYHERLLSSIAAGTSTLFGETILFEFDWIAASLLQIMGVLTALLGSRFFFALAFDSARLALLHIHLLSEMFAACLRFEMSALKSFWLLFTGKKRNVLRQRSDHLHYDHMQLLLGMILFSTSLFLFTTVMVYHWFFAVTNLMVEILFCTLLFLYVSLEWGVQCERLILRRRMNRSNDTWKGNEVQFIPVSLHESISSVDTSYVMHLYDIGSERNDLQSTFVLPNMSIEYQKSCVLKVKFRSESDFSIVSAALISSISSMLSRLPTLIRRLLIGSQCNLANSFLGVTNSLIKGK